MVDFTKPLLTRDGREARLLSTSSDYTMGGIRYPIVAEVAHPTKPGIWSRQHFTIEGHYHHGKPNDDGNLMNWVWTPPKTNNWELTRALRAIQLARNLTTPSILRSDPVYVYPGLSLSTSSDIERVVLTYQHYSINYACEQWPDVAREMYKVRGERTYDLRPFAQVPNMMPLSLPIVNYGGEANYVMLDLSKTDDVICKLVLTGYFPVVWRALMERMEGMWGWETMWSTVSRSWLNAALREGDKK